MLRVIFKKEKYEQHMIRELGASELLLMKLNSTEVDQWPEILDEKDITDDLEIMYNKNNTMVYSVKWKERIKDHSSQEMYCFILPEWTEVINKEEIDGK